MAIRAGRGGAQPVGCTWCPHGRSPITCCKPRCDGSWGSEVPTPCPTLHKGHVPGFLCVGPGGSSLAHCTVQPQKCPQDSQQETLGQRSCIASQECLWAPSTRTVFTAAAEAAGPTWEGSSTHPTPPPPPQGSSCAGCACLCVGSRLGEGEVPCPCSSLN